MMLCGCPKTWRCPFVRESPANVTILAAKLDDMLKVPNAVLRFRPSAAVLKKTGLSAVQGDKQQVYVLAGGKIDAVPVKFGLSDLASSTTREVKGKYYISMTAEQAEKSSVCK
jgi:hypothetical protein